jgi:hypothetical protein
MDKERDWVERRIRFITRQDNTKEEKESVSEFTIR